MNFTWKTEIGSLDSILNDLYKKLLPLEVKIIKTVHQAVIEAKKEYENTEQDIRTEKVLEVSRNLGKNLGYFIPDQEWLLDCVWFLAKKEPYFVPEEFIENFKLTSNIIKRKESLWWSKIEKIKLACEVEWHGAINEIFKDFLKLCVLNSDIRLYIHSNNYYDDKNNINTVDVCKSILERFKNNRFLFIGFDIDKTAKTFKKEFRIDLCII